ncbi:MAG: sulfatase-like hydrolase/transferase [Planctomycetaceae bacterium]
MTTVPMRERVSIPWRACRLLLRAAWMAAVGLMVCGIATDPRGCTAADAVTPPGRPPNIVVILADDLGIGNVSCYGADAFRTPHIDALAAAGMRFTRCYSAPNCGPSRALMMTGRYGFRTGMTGNDKTAVKLLRERRKDEAMMPKVLAARGYATASAGKWSQIPLDPSDWGFDEFIRTNGSGAYWPSEDRATYTINGEEKPWPQGVYMPDLTHDFVVDFIARHRDRPFYVHYALAGVHTPIQRTPDSPPDSADLFTDNVAYMDTLVGRLMADLDRLGVRDETLVIFTGDNGVHPGKGDVSTIGGRRLSGAKGTLLEGGSRVPLVAAWPGRIAAGRVCDDLVSFTDFLPTCAELAGAELPAGLVIDGRSFAPQLLGRPGTPRESLLVMLGRHWYVRDARWKLTDAGELFDLADAPFVERAVPADSPNAEAAAGRKRLAAVLADLDPAAGRLGEESGKHGTSDR